MRVDAPLINPENLDSQKVENPGSSTTQTRPTSVKSSQDQARLSVDAGKIEQLKAQVSSLPEVRQDRVAALSQAVQSGSYQVTDQQLASAIHSDLLTG
jgi:flagellar biosynthesis anti-sigma factor FlgM